MPKKTTKKKAGVRLTKTEHELVAIWAASSFNRRYPAYRHGLDKSLDTTARAIVRNWERVFGDRKGCEVNVPK